MTTWTTADMPAQAGKTWVVTGANSGLGLETVKALAAKGARVVMACRDVGRAEAALAEVRGATPDAQVELRALDLASLGSVQAFAESLGGELPALDGLVNNAGVMAVPRALTADGFELQLGTNHLGHFALTLRLLPLLEAAPASRVVTVSSTVHRFAEVRFDDLMGERRYSAWGAYAQSKLANLYFMLELHRRLSAAGKRTRSVAAHPGYAATNLQGVAPRLTGSRFAAWLMNTGNALFAQTAGQGALPQLYAATAPEVEGGQYFGPDGFYEMAGPPRRVEPTARARDVEVAARLWATSEELTSVAWPA